MKYYYSAVLIIVMVSVCSAQTVFQPWDANGWTRVDQAGSVINVQPGGAHYVTATPFQRNAVAGYAGLHIPLEAPILSGTTGGNIPKCWIQYDYRYDGGQSHYTCFLGFYNTSGTNAYPTTLESLSVGMGGSSVQPWGKNATVTLTGAAINRIKVHIYTYDGNTVMDVNVYSYNMATDAITQVSGVNKHVVVNSSQSYANTLDVFGFRNTANSSVRAGNYSFDNVYFSTEGPYVDTVPPPFGMTCTNSTGDFTGDCKVNFKDLAVLSEEWLDCALVPARFCYTN